MSAFRIGLTGGIASGKSAASRHFERLGVPVIDTDLLSRELVEPGQPALAEIIELCGNSVVDVDGRLDRSRLRQMIFADSGLRTRLESILHPRIRDEMLRRADALDAPYVVLVIPLLIETGQQALVDRVLLIDVPPDIQRDRVRQRDGIDDAQVDRVLAAQASREQRRRLADDIIDNSGEPAQLQSAIERLHADYLALVASAGKA